MSTNRSRARLHKATTNKEYRVIFLKEMYPPYWDDGIRLYGNKFSYQCRMYKTWKHYRKHQWKETSPLPVHGQGTKM